MQVIYTEIQKREFTVINAMNDNRNELNSIHNQKPLAPDVYRINRKRLTSITQTYLLRKYSSKTFIASESSP
jgi:hypothetical protein